MSGRVGSLAVAVFLTVAVLLGLSLAVAGAPAEAGEAPGQTDAIGDADDVGLAAVASEPVPAGSPDEVDPDAIEIDVELADDGSADWEIQFRVLLDDGDAEAAFEELEEDVADDPESYTERFAERIDATVENAASTTDRTMEADGYDVRTERQSLTREYGVLTYSFRWHGFATVDDDELHAGDAIDRYYLDDDTRLAISWPAEYELSSVTPEPDDDRTRTVIWRGTDTDFVTGEPRVVVEREGSLPTALFVVGGVAIVAVAGLAATWWYRRGGGSDAPSGVPDAPSGASDGQTTTTDGQAPDTDGPTATESAGMADDRDTSVANADADTAGETDHRSSTPSEPDPEEFLSNEERVLRLLEERGGRLKQQQVVQELGWTDAKTSQVVTGLREDGELESFRLGRENVLVLPDEADEVTDSGI